MKMVALFKVYRRMRSHMDTCRQNRRVRFGIAVEDDYWARKWQYAQLGIVPLERRIISALKEIDETNTQQPHEVK